MYSVKRILLGAALAFALNGSLMSNVMAQPEESWMGIPADAPLDVNLQGYKFSVPAAYIPWPLSPLMQGENLRTLWFTYWFPDKGPILEKSADERRAQIESRMKEGKFSLADEFFVQVELSVLNAKGRLAANDDAFIKPLQQYKSLLESKSPDYFKIREGDLFTMLVDSTDQIKFVSKPDADPQFFMRCSSLTKPMPICFGDTYYEGTPFVLLISIPLASMRRLPDVISTTRELVESWAIK